MTYYKGHHISSGKCIIVALYDKPQTDVEGDEYIAVASALEQSGITKYKTFDECEWENYIQREISESEYNSYVLIQTLLTEMFLHDFTGGFPRGRNVLSVMRKLPGEVNTWLSEVGF